MDLYEYQARDLFEKYEVPVLAGIIADTPEEAKAAAEKLGGVVVVKAQVKTGGRGKAGGVKVAKTADEAYEHAKAILGMDIKGHTVHQVMIAQGADIAEEYYFSVLLDRANRSYLSLASVEGGMEIEELAVERPDALAKVEVDPLTGTTRVDRFTAVDDFGNIVNPMIVEGQVHGGVGQGIGQALLENTAFDENGQLKSGSFMDYAMPRAGDVPNITVDHSCRTPCTHNPLGVKGCGEAGAIGSPPAVVNAVLDALNRGGIRVDHIDMPVSPARVWAAIQAAR